jgi:ferredoxin
MKLTQTTAIYFSPTHTTEKSVMALAAGTDVPYRGFDLTLPDARRTFSRNFAKGELVIVGLPVYGGRLPKNLDDFFSGMNGNEAAAVAVVVYGNREYDDALLELKMKLEERGFTVKAAATFIGEHTFSNKIATGRPDTGDLAMAQGFGKRVLESINLNTTGILTVGGAFPFKAKGSEPGLVPSTSDICTKCGQCAENCPWGAIDRDDVSVVDSTKCLACARCIRVCPSGAKQFTDEKFLAFIPEFEKRLNAHRREPELFLPH